MFPFPIRKERPLLGLTGMGGGAGGVLAGGAGPIPDYNTSGGAIHQYADPGGNLYRIHVFGQPGTFVYTDAPAAPGALNIDVMVIGGGGSGGTTYGDQDAGKGGGGSGGMAWVAQYPVAEGTTCPITIGAGGAGFYEPRYGGGDPVSNPGSPSTFVCPTGPHTFTAIGGGGGGVADSTPAPFGVPTIGTDAGNPGGSGGGGGTRNSPSYAGGEGTQADQNPGQPWTTNYGNDGGSGDPGGGNGGGGGGGGTGGAGGGATGSGDSRGGPGGVGNSTFVTGQPTIPTTDQTLSFLKAASAGTQNSYVYVNPTSTSAYIGGGGSGSNGNDAADDPSGVEGGYGGGGRSSAGLENTYLLETGFWPEIGGYNHTGGGGGAAQDDHNYQKTVAAAAGRGGCGIVIVRYALDDNKESQATAFISATGGDSVATDGDYKVHTFQQDGTPTSTGHTFEVTGVSDVSSLNTLEVLVVGGGGSGGMLGGGGGGAGGIAHTYNYPVHTDLGSVPISIPLQVAVGGAAVTSNGPGNNGGDSYFGPNPFARMRGVGGGCGMGNNDAVGNGGCGGGGQYPITNDPQEKSCGRSWQMDWSSQGGNTNGVNPKIVCYNYGYPGGHGPGPNSESSGGGGAGGSGQNAPNSPYNAGGGNGGNGQAFSITGSPVTYGGGGGGAVPGDDAGGGTGGGGEGGGPAPGNDGTNHLGGGGGGCYSGPPTQTSGKGGTGVVIVRYKYK